LATYGKLGGPKKTFWGPHPQVGRKKVAPRKMKKNGETVAHEKRGGGGGEKKNEARCTPGETSPTSEDLTKKPGYSGLDRKNRKKNPRTNPWPLMGEILGGGGGPTVWFKKKNGGKNQKGEWDEVTNRNKKKQTKNNLPPGGGTKGRAPHQKQGNKG